MPRVVVGPERHHGLARRAPGQCAGNLGDKDRRVRRELETLARPRLHPAQGCDVVRTFLERLQHCRSSLTAAGVRSLLTGALEPQPASRIAAFGPRRADLCDGSKSTRCKSRLTARGPLLECPAIG